MNAFSTPCYDQGMSSKVKLSIISIPSQAVALPETSFFPPCFGLFWTSKNLKHIQIQSTFGIQFLHRLWGQNLAIIHITPRWIRWGQFQWVWRLELDVFQQFICSFGEFSKSPKYPNFWSFLKLEKLWFEFNWIDFCNLLGRVCKHSLLKSSSNTPRKWNDYITSAGPLVGNRCWIQPAGRAKACETNGWHHSCLSDVFSEKHLGKLDCIILISGQSLRIWWSDSKSL